MRILLGPALAVMPLAYLLTFFATVNTAAAHVYHGSAFAEGPREVPVRYFAQGAHPKFFSRRTHGLRGEIGLRVRPWLVGTVGLHVYVTQAGSINARYGLFPTACAD